MHQFKFPRFALLVYKGRRDVLYFVEARFYDHDHKGSPVYLLTPSTTDCPCVHGAEYVESAFSEYEKQASVTIGEER